MSLLITEGLGAEAGVSAVMPLELRVTRDLHQMDLTVENELTIEVLGRDAALLGMTVEGAELSMEISSDGPSMTMTYCEVD